MEPLDPNDPTNLAYSMFMLSGNPGYYMLYSDLMHGEESEAEREARERR